MKIKTSNNTDSELLILTPIEPVGQTSSGFDDRLIDKFVGSGSFASVFSLKNDKENILRVTHDTLNETLLANEEQGFKNNFIVKDIPHVNQIYEYGSYKVDTSENNKITFCDRTLPNKNRRTLCEKVQTYFNTGKGKKTIKKRFINLFKQKPINPATGLYGIIEKCDGDELGKYMERQIHIDNVITIVKQLLTGLSGIHKNIAHLDLKQENILLKKKVHLDTRSNDIDIKIIDFGLSRRINTKLTNIYGTPGYISPEVLSNKEITVSGKSDIWAVGIITLELLFGVYIPYKIYNRHTLYDNRNLETDTKLIKTRYTNQGIPGDKFEALFELITDMLTTVIEDRKDADTLLNSNIFNYSYSEKPVPAPIEKPVPAPIEKPAPAPIEKPAPAPIDPQSISNDDDDLPDGWGPNFQNDTYGSGKNNGGNKLNNKTRIRYTKGTGTTKQKKTRKNVNRKRNKRLK